MNWQSLAGRDRRALLIGTVSILVMLVSYRGIPAWMTWRAEARIDARDAMQQSLQMNQVLDALPPSLDTLQARTRLLLEHTPALFVGGTRDAAASEMMDAVRTMARASWVRIDDVIIIQDTAGSNTLSPIELRLHGVGDVVGLAAFLSRLESGPLLLAVRNLSVTPESIESAANQVEVLDLQLTVEGLALVAGDSALGRP